MFSSIYQAILTIFEMSQWFFVLPKTANKVLLMTHISYLIATGYKFTTATVGSTINTIRNKQQQQKKHQRGASTLHREPVYVHLHV